MRDLGITLWTAVVATTLAWALPACVRDDGARRSADQTLLDPDKGWADGNREALEELVRTHGKDSPGYDPARPPVAVFDWDNTVIKNDVGNGTFYWFLQNDGYRAPVGGDWGATSAYLTEAARAALAAACDQTTDDGRLATSRDADCVAEMLAIYHDRKTVAGAAAWRDEGFDHRAFEPEYAWLAQLLAGDLPGEVRDRAQEAIDAYLVAPVGATLSLGGRDGLEGYIRIYEPMRKLIGVLREHGFDVWIVSASPEPIVQTFAERVGIDRDHVVGIRTLQDAEGRLTAELAGCGPVADGDNTLITYIEGKRCWIDRAIFGGAGTLQPSPDEARRPVFVAGDAVTDIAMLRDATALRLVIDRQNPELLCHALAGTGGRWLVQPMFIEPLPARSEPYPCATTACKGSDGAPTACLDAAGAPLADQLPPVASP